MAFLTFFIADLNELFILQHKEYKNTLDNKGLALALALVVRVLVVLAGHGCFHKKRSCG